jgi:hypothetical protein
MCVHRRKIEDAAFERMCRLPNNLFSLFCKRSATSRPNPWAEMLRKAQPNDEPVEPDTDDEQDEFDDCPDALEEEAQELAGDEGGEVDVAPVGPTTPLNVLDLDHVAGTWSDVSGMQLPKTVEGHGEAFLRANGRTIATFKGTLKRGEPHGHGRLEMSGSGDGWCGEMLGGMVAGYGEAWDETGNKFLGSTSAPRWLVEEAASTVRRAAAAVSKANAPFDAKTVERTEIKPMLVAALRAALLAAHVDEKGLKAELITRLVEVRRQAHLAKQRDNASSEELIVAEGGYAGTVIWAGGREEHGLFEESTFKLLHNMEMIVATKAATKTAIDLAELAADAVHVVTPMDVEG